MQAFLEETEDAYLQAQDDDEGFGLPIVSGGSFTEQHVSNLLTTLPNNI